MSLPEQQPDTTTYVDGPAKAPTHYRIYVYGAVLPPQGEPTAVSLCPWRRGRNGALTGDIDLVTCSLCLRHMRELGLDHFEQD